MVEKSGVGKSRVGKFMVEKSKIERSGVEALGLKVQGCNVLQPFQPPYGLNIFITVFRRGSSHTHLGRTTPGLGHAFVYL